MVNHGISRACETCRKRRKKVGVRIPLTRADWLTTIVRRATTSKTSLDDTVNMNTNGMKIDMYALRQGTQDLLGLQGR
jgi:hypothetical protein